MNTITLPRSVVEQAMKLLDALSYDENYDYDGCFRRWSDYAKPETLSSQLRAALEQPQSVTDCHQSQPRGEQEPVAWAEEIIEYLHAHYNTEMIKELDSGDALIRLDDAIAAVEEVAQRYTNPQPKREPLTVGQINRLVADGEIPLSGNPYEVTRAIERAHKIGGAA